MPMTRPRDSNSSLFHVRAVMGSVTHLMPLVPSEISGPKPLLSSVRPAAGMAMLSIGLEPRESIRRLAISSTVNWSMNLFQVSSSSHGIRRISEKVRPLSAPCVKSLTSGASAGFSYQSRFKSSSSASFMAKAMRSTG